MTGHPQDGPGTGAVLPYGTEVRVNPGRISLTCLATCGHGNACAVIGERGPDQQVSLYFHGADQHGARLSRAQIEALVAWLGNGDP